MNATQLKQVLATCLLLLLPGACLCAQTVSGRVTDAADGTPLPFATIKLGNTGQGVVTGLDGRYSFTYREDITYADVLYTGYEKLRVTVTGPTDQLNIILHARQNELDEVVITPPRELIYRVLQSAIDNRDKNNPEKYDWYRCKVYYKMVADADYNIPDSLVVKDTTGETKELVDFLDEQHLLLSETYSRRTWKRPQKLQEEVLGSRLSGFKKSLFTGMITDVLPFHSYHDYLSLNGKDYHNPVSGGYRQHYNYDLEDEFLSGLDTVWVISYRPKNNYSGLSGKVYINSHQYAIAYFTGSAEDKTLNRDIRLEQQYQLVDGRWFPRELNYKLRYSILDDKKSDYKLYMSGYSRIDSVTFAEEKGFRFDKAHSTKLIGKADELSDPEWDALRPESLSGKEEKTYIMMDSLMEEAGMDRVMKYLEKLPEGKVPVSVVDVDLGRLYSFNRYEGSRWGLGLQTNEQIVKWASLGGWAGYGVKDREWKYGGFLELYADRHREFVFRVGYEHDLRDPARVMLHKEIDRNYLRRYLMFRVDEVEALSASVKKRLGYWTLELGGRREHIIPRYAYRFDYNGQGHSSFDATELSLNWRYAFAERRAPFFGRYYGTGSKYPVWYGKVTAGQLESGSYGAQYVQLLTGTQWHKHINRLGYEHVMLLLGKTWSNSPLPLSKTFAGNGMRYDNNNSYYTFGGLLTMYPYEYYSDDFVSVIWKHDFDWRLFLLSHAKAGLSSAPYFSVGHNFIYGGMRDRAVHAQVPFSVPDGQGYHESGIMLNSLLRLKYFNVYHLTLNVGYYYHWTPVFDLEQNGRYLLGFGVDL